MQLEGFANVTPILAQGIYALVYRGVVVYIGRSKCALTRVATHKSMRGKKQVPWITARGVLFDEVHVMPCHPDRIEALEAELIRRYRPRYNTHHNPGGPSGPPIEIHPGIILGSRPAPAPVLRVRPLQ